MTHFREEKYVSNLDTGRVWQNTKTKLVMVSLGSDNDFSNLSNFHTLKLFPISIVNFYNLKKCILIKRH